MIRSKYATEQYLKRLRTKTTVDSNEKLKKAIGQNVEKSRLRVFLVEYETLHCLRFCLILVHEVVQTVIRCVAAPD